MGRVRKVMLTIAGSILALVIGDFCYDTWADWQYKYHGAWEAAGIEPIPGAELVSYKYDPNGFLPDFDTTWTYRVPATYTDKLYKDCSAMHYKTGVVIGYENDGTERIDPKASGCHNEPGNEREIISIQFSGDQLTIQDIRSF